MDNGRIAEILLIEDNRAEARLMAEGLKACEIRNSLHVATSGDEALAFLHRRGAFAGAVRPDLVFLDIKLPGRDGFDVLAEVKSDEELKRIPVVVLSSSAAERDVVAAYSLHANCYVVKPVNFYQFLRVMKVIEKFWLTVVQLPTHGQPS